MEKIILVSSTQYPGFGGAATNAYAIIKFLREKGYTVFGIFFENAKINVDPDQIGNIYRFDCSTFEKNNRNGVNKYRNFLNKQFGNNKPSIMLCKNYKAPIYCHSLYPDATNIYLVSGISHFSNFYPYVSAQEFLSNDNISIPDYEPEIKTIECSDMIVVNSIITLNTMYKIYPKYIDRFYPNIVDTTKEIEILFNLNVNQIPKTYDIIVAASILTRPMKNNEFLIDVLSSPYLSNYSKLIIGKENHKFKEIPNSDIYDMLSHPQLIQFLKKSKLLLYPSLSDANPNTVREALHCRCITLLSNNIGYHEKFPTYSVCTSYDTNEWISKIIFILENYDLLIDKYHIEFDGESIDEFMNKIIN